MTERLVIKNFGPIKKADINLRELTIFVGPQATGKSLAAQSVYFLRRYETLLLSLSDTPVKATISALEKWLGQELSIYAQPKTRLYWNPNVSTLLKFILKNQKPIFILLLNGT